MFTKDAINADDPNSDSPRSSCKNRHGSGTFTAITTQKLVKEVHDHALQDRLMTIRQIVEGKGPSDRVI